MTAWIFTFGHGQRLRSTNRAGRADFDWNGQPTVGDGFPLHNRYVRIEGEHDQARGRMIALFGAVWSMEYADGPEARQMIRDYRLVELDLADPVGVPRQAWLGLASTCELLRELRARGECEVHDRGAGARLASDAAKLIAYLPEPILNYRTIEGRSQLPAERAP